MLVYNLITTVHHSCRCGQATLSDLEHCLLVLMHCQQPSYQVLIVQWTLYKNVKDLKDKFSSCPSTILHHTNHQATIWPQSLPSCDTLPTAILPNSSNIVGHCTRNSKTWKTSSLGADLQSCIISLIIETVDNSLSDLNRCLLVTHCYKPSYQVCISNTVGHCTRMSKTWKISSLAADLQSCIRLLITAAADKPLSDLRHCLSNFDVARMMSAT